jgi:hypothetical protein
MTILSTNQISVYNYFYKIKFTYAIKFNKNFNLIKNSKNVVREKL